MDDFLTLPSTAAASPLEGQIESLRVKSLSGQSQKMDDRQMRAIADEFETLIMRQLLKEMRKTVPHEGYIEQSFSTEMYMEIVDDHLARQLAETNELGLDRLIYEELKAKNEKIATPDERPAQDQSPGGREGTPPPVVTGPRFIPLAPDTEKFLELRSSSPMMELPRPRNPYRPLNGHPRVSTSRIESPTRLEP